MSALPEYEFEGNQTSFFPSVLATIKRGEAIWSRWPAGEQNMGSMFFHPEDAARIVAQGWTVIDGIRAKTRYELPVGYHSPITGWVPPCPHTVCLEFEAPFRAHP